MTPQAGRPPVWLSNFGLLFEEPPDADAGAGSDAAPDATSGADAGAGARKYGLVCEESFGGKVPETFVRHPDGRLLLATFDGVYAGAEDGCGFARATGSTAFQSVPILVVDPRDAGHIYALTRTPPALHESRDGGRSFVMKLAFPADLRVERLYAIDTNPTTTLFLGAYVPSAEPLVVGLSEDDGQSFVYFRHGKDAFSRTNVAAQLDGPLPGAPGVLFAATGAPTGSDEIWRSEDGGRSFVRVLALGGNEVRAGVVAGSGGVVYVAGRDLVPSTSRPPAHLHVSRDGGKTFAPGRPSPATGPSFRCLGAAEGRLYACAGGPADTFLFGVSDDDGATWTPTVTINDITGPRACTSGRCLATAIWLCDSYGICPDGLPRPQSDGGSADGTGVDQDAPHEAGPDALTGDGDDAGCGCRLGGRGSRSDVDGGRRQGGVALTVIAFALARTQRRRRGRISTPDRDDRRRFA